MGGPSARCVMMLVLSTALRPGSGTQLLDAIAGPFRIIPDHLEDCPKELRPRKEYVWHSWSGIRDRKRPDVWVYSWNGSTSLTVDDDLTGRANFAAWSSRGGWIDNAHIMTVPRACTVMRLGIPSFWKAMMVALFDNPNAACPFPPGRYSFINLSTDYDIDTPPAFFFGKWRVTATVFRYSTSEQVFCLRAFFATAPKLKRLREET